MKIYMKQYSNFQYAVYFLLCLFMMSFIVTKNMKANTIASKEIKDTSEEPVLQTKLQDGFDFYAHGQDANWELSLDFEKDFTFKLADGFRFSTPAVEGIKAQDANVVRYRAVVESGEMIIQLYKQECVNSSTGKKSPYKVTVEIKRGIDKDYNTAEACGRYVFDERIHDM